MVNEQVAIGGLTAILCVAGLCSQEWLLRETKKGKWLVNRFGPAAAVWLLRAFLAAGVGFGVLLATNVIRPVAW